VDDRDNHFDIMDQLSGWIWYKILGFEGKGEDESNGDAQESKR
jgi:hypothetical protein